MDNNIQMSWERFLTPEVLRTNLILASVYVTGFEMLQDSITERVRDVYLPGFDESRQIDPKYERDVLGKNKSVTYASLRWLKESHAINDSDIMKFTQAKDFRNLVSHEMPRMLIEGLPTDITDRFNDIIFLLDKIEKWWIVNFDIPTNPDFDDKIVNEKEIVPGRVASLKIMLDVALGSDEEAMYYIKELKKG